MWFRTRVGLSSVVEPFEVSVAKYPEAKHPIYLIYARSLNDTELQYRGIFGDLKSPVRWLYLAKFEYSERSLPRISQCMTLIEEAIAHQTRVCDLGAAGDADAWTKASSDCVLLNW